MLVRPVETGEIEQLAELRVEFMADEHGVARDAVPEAVVAATTAFVREEHHAGRMRSWFAITDGQREPIGCASLILHRLPPRIVDVRTTEGYVVNMYVRPAHRRSGVARALLAALVTGAESLGVRTVNLHATTDGRHLYESSGFVTPPSYMILPRPAGP